MPGPPCRCKGEQPQAKRRYTTNRCHVCSHAPRPVVSVVISSARRNTTSIYNTGSTAHWISRARPLSVVVVIFAAVALACQLRHVHDSTGLSRDIGMVGKVLTGLFCESLFFFFLPFFFFFVQQVW